MDVPHWVYVAGAIIIEVTLNVGILFGAEARFPKSMNIKQSVRDVCIALWAFLVPAWFQFETFIFAPTDKRSDAYAAFAHGQQSGQLVAAIIGGVVAIMIGATAPKVEDLRRITGKQ